MNLESKTITVTEKANTTKTTVEKLPVENIVSSDVRNTLANTEINYSNESLEDMYLIIDKTNQLFGPSFKKYMFFGMLLTYTGFASYLKIRKGVQMDLYKDNSENPWVKIKNLFSKKVDTNNDKRSNLNLSRVYQKKSRNVAILIIVLFVFLCAGVYFAKMYS